MRDEEPRSWRTMPWWERPCYVAAIAASLLFFWAFRLAFMAEEW